MTSTSHADIARRLLANVRAGVGDQGLVELPTQERVGLVLAILTPDLDRNTFDFFGPHVRVGFANKTTPTLADIPAGEWPLDKGAADSLVNSTAG